MTVCLALLGDSASPGARKRMFSGFPYWKRHMLSTYGIEVAGPASLGGISSQTVPRGPSPLPWATEHYAVLRVGSQSCGSWHGHSAFWTMVSPPCSLFLPIFPSTLLSGPPHSSVPTQRCPMYVSEHSGQVVRCQF